MNGRLGEIQIIVRLADFEEQIRRNFKNVVESIKPGNGYCGN